MRPALTAVGSLALVWSSPARVSQQWKEGLRQIVPDPMTAEEQEMENLRRLLRLGAGIGTPSDDYTPYQGRPHDEIVRRAVMHYAKAVNV